MKFILGPVLGTLLLLTSCAAQSQNTPQVVPVPADEMTRQPSVAPATTSAPGGTPMSTVTATPTAPPEKLSYSSCNVDGPYIAMTFDDGPSAKLTPQLLDMLKARGIKATFFMVGQNVAENPEIVRRMVAEGHEVANHSWSHPALNTLSPAGLDAQISKTTNAIQEACGQKVTLLRPPYGATGPMLDRKINKQYGLKVILWSVDPLDWKYRNSDHVYNEIIKGVHPGAIILSHDIHATTVAAMPRVFDALLAKGYKFVTVSELIAMDRPKPPPTPGSTEGAKKKVSPTPVISESPTPAAPAPAEPTVETNPVTPKPSPAN